MTAGKGNRKVLVLGGGKYGKKACLYFKQQKARVVLVDNDPGCQARSCVPDNDFVLQDAGDAWQLALKLEPDYIVPTHPGHTCGKWIRDLFHLQPLKASIGKVIGRMPPSLLLHRDQDNACLTFSYSPRGRLCPENCMPAPDRCALTGEPRPAPLYELLEYAVFRQFDCSRIFASAQVAPGIGAIKTADILEFIREVQNRKPETLAVGTACLCHGILNLFRTSPARPSRSRNQDAPGDRDIDSLASPRMFGL